MSETNHPVPIQQGRVLDEHASAQLRSDVDNGPNFSQWVDVNFFNPVDYEQTGLRTDLEKQGITDMKVVDQLAQGALQRQIEARQKLVDDRKVLTNELWQKHEAERTDSLTGLPNRKGFVERLTAMMGEDFEFGERVVMFVDLDHFKALNDRLGHDVADVVLERIGRGFTPLDDTRTGASKPDSRLTNEYESARLGGDEFAITKRESKAARLMSPEQRIKEEQQYVEGLVRQAVVAAKPTIEHMKPDEKREVVLGASVGVIFPRPGQSLESVMEEADLAVYDVKTQNKLQPTEDERRQKREEFVEDPELFEGLLDDPRSEDVSRTFADNCRRYMDALNTDQLDKLVIPDQYRSILDAVVGDPKIGKHLLARIEFIATRGIEGYKKLEEAVPDSDYSSMYANKAQSLDDELSPLLLDALVIYKEKLESLAR